MVSKKFSLLRSNSNAEVTNNNVIENISVLKETKVTEKASKYSDSIVKADKNLYPILDKKVISFVVSHFPDVSKDIINSLANLKNTLEKSIDYIEDTSSQIIKKERNFELSRKYRENTMNLYDISLDIEKYIAWMETQSKDEKPTIKETVVENPTKTIQSANTSSVIKELNICEDFTEKEPIAFKLDNFNIPVDDWNDLIMKTADLLIKNYNKSKNLYYSNIKAPNLSSKKSLQNEFRDTVIEILLEYRIDPVKYLVVLK